MNGTLHPARDPADRALVDEPRLQHGHGAVRRTASSRIAVVLMAIGLWFDVRREPAQSARAPLEHDRWSLAACCRSALGIATLLTRVPLNLAVLHQAGAP